MCVEVINGKPPSKSNCYMIITLRSKGGISHGSLAKTDALMAYENNFYLQCQKYRGANIKGLFKLFLKVYYPANRADLDNSLKIILDCLQKCDAITNDNKCVGIVTEKYIDKDNERIEFALREIGKPVSDELRAFVEPMFNI